MADESIEVRIEPLPGAEQQAAGTEFVRRRGVGHPDALCDALAEAVVLALARHYRQRFGQMLPVAVDRVAIVAGRTRPRFGGGAVDAPINLWVHGRAVYRFRTLAVPVAEIARRAVRQWLRTHLHAMDADRQVRVHCHLREIEAREVPESPDWTVRDAVFAVGHAPLDALESAVLAAEHALNCAATRQVCPALAEDVEVTGIRSGGTTRFQACCALVDAEVADPGAAREALALAGDRVREAVARAGMPDAVVGVDGVADDAQAKWLTVTGTRAEAGRDGTSGRSQGPNGLHCSTWGAASTWIAGSDPATDPERLYALTAGLIANALAPPGSGVGAVHCWLAAGPGDDLRRPRQIVLRTRMRDPDRLAVLRERTQDIARDALQRMPSLWREWLGQALALDGWPFDREEPDPLQPGGLYGEARAGMLRAVVAAARETAQFTGRPVLSPPVLAALEKVPRHRFVLPEDRPRAYLDSPLPIGDGQTISQPFIVALMTDLAGIEPGAKVLEVGTGSGYQSAVLAELRAEIYSIERIGALHERAARRLGRLGYANVALRLGDGRRGWPEASPFDAVLVTAAAEGIPEALIAQLRPGGRLVLPLIEDGEQTLVVATRADGGAPTRYSVLPVQFVPMLGGPG